MIQPPRILFFPDAIQGADSGAFSARETRRQLLSLGYEVAVFCATRSFPVGTPFHDEMINFPVSKPLRWTGHIYSSTFLVEFDRACQAFEPDFVFFAGGISKPSVLARRARIRGIRTVYLFYINDFFCNRVYAGRESGPCTACAARNEFLAVQNGCVSLSGTAKFVKASLVRALVGREVRRAHKVLSYSEEQSRLYELFGVPRSSIAKIALQFSPDDLKGANLRDEGYFVITGQPIMQKGFHLLAQILPKLRTRPKLKLSLRDDATARRVIDEFRLGSFIESGLLEVVTGLSRRHDYIDFLAGARGVLLPTYYHTTGEFVLQEALFLQKPVHAFNVGAHRNLLKDGENALVSAVADLSDYSLKIDRINSDPLLRGRISAAARQTSDDFYAPEQIDQFRTVFE